jgi:hypothetical protein
MKTYVRLALIIGAAAALCAGCGASQQPIGATAAPQSEAASHPQRLGSWMLQKAVNQNLLYASNDEASEVDVYSYPQGSKVGVLTGFDSPKGECVDASGNIWIVNQTPPEIIEYAHGGSSPIATLSVPGSSPAGCAVDPSTGNLAVTSQGDQVSVYADAGGTPTTYTDSHVNGFGFCGYDNSGNLFVAAGSTRDGVLVELPNGSSFITLTFKPQPKHLHISGVQWDGEYIAAGGVAENTNSPSILYRLQVVGSVATIEGEARLGSPKLAPVTAQFWIQGKTVVQSTNHGAQIGFWPYPAGGGPHHLIRTYGRRTVWGTAVSLAQ